jgi:urease accessory protein
MGAPAPSALFESGRAVYPSLPMDEPFERPRMQRAWGEAVAEIGPGETRSRLLRLRQAGSLRLRFPRVVHGPVEAVLVNTAGGLAGGDRLSQSFRIRAGAELSVVTQACERVYASLGADAAMRTEIAVGEGASLAWLPQETILFDRARLARELHVEAAGTSRLLLCESVILGREAMGESVREGLLRDRWRVRVDGRLAFADDLRLDGDIAHLTAARASLAGNRAFATVLALGPEPDMTALRALLGPLGGASRVEGLTIVRLVAPSGIALRKTLVPALQHLASGPLPRLWSM